MKTVGTVLNTFSAKKGQSGLPRPLVSSLNIIDGYGIEHDKFAGKDAEKAVMIVGKIAYDIADKSDIKLLSGSLGENIILDFNPHDYPVKTVLRIGSAVLQITHSCTICNHLSQFGDALPFLVRSCRGVYCKILDGGEIKQGMSVEILTKWNKNKKMVS